MKLTYVQKQFIKDYFKNFRVDYDPIGEWAVFWGLVFLPFVLILWIPWRIFKFPLTSIANWLNK